MDTVQMAVLFQQYTVLVLVTLFYFVQDVVVVVFHIVVDILFIDHVTHMFVLVSVELRVVLLRVLHIQVDVVKLK